MTLSKILLPALAATLLGGCVYEEIDEVSYAPPRRVYQSGYASREVVVVDRGPTRYYNQPNAYPYYANNSRGYYQQVPQRTYYNNRPYVNAGYVNQNHHDHHGESWDERQRRELREAQRAREKKNDDKKKKKKKKDDD